jgi:hypothetical protein
MTDPTGVSGRPQESSGRPGAAGVKTAPLAAKPKPAKALVRQLLGFGDIWLFDQILKRTGLDTVLENLIPGKSDTLKALIGYKALEKDAFIFAEDWYPNSYASVLYPQAKIDRASVSEFHAELGSDAIFNKFFQSYLKTAIKRKGVKERISLAAAIDGADASNENESFLTAVNNGNIFTSDEMRITYVMDSITELPLFMKITPGIFAGVSTLVNTAISLAALGVDVNLLLTDTARASAKKIDELLEYNIPFLAATPQYGKVYKTLINNFGADLKSADNVVNVAESEFYVKKVPTDYGDRRLFAYIALDIEQSYIDERNALKAYQNGDEDDARSVYRESLANAGKIVFISSKDYQKDEVFSLYNARRMAAQLIDMAKIYAGVTPIQERDVTPNQGHSEETIRGILLISFIATAARAFLDYTLSGSEFSARDAFIKMKYWKLMAFERHAILSELTQEQNDILKHSRLSPPFEIESENEPRKRDSFSLVASPTKRGRGRPKSAQNAPDAERPSRQDAASDPASNFGGKRGRGRPKGSLNKPRQSQPNALVLGAPTPSVGAPRGRGRPKGSANKP